MDAKAGRLEKGVLVSGAYALRRQFVFYDRDIWGNRRLKGTCLVSAHTLTLLDSTKNTLGTH
jgi:hypothetical protein